MWDRLDERSEAADERVDRLTNILDRLDERHSDFAAKLKQIKHVAASEAKFTRTQKAIKKKVILNMEDDESKIDGDLANARLKFVSLKNHIARLEDAVSSPCIDLSSLP